MSAGDTKVLVGIFGPRPAKGLRAEHPDRAQLEVNVIPATGFADDAAAELADTLCSVFSNVLQLTAFPRTIITASVHVIHDAGSLLATCLNCLTLASVDAGLPLYSLVSAVSGYRAQVALVKEGATQVQGYSALDLLKAEEEGQAEESSSEGAAQASSLRTHGVLALSSRETDKALLWRCYSAAGPASSSSSSSSVFADSEQLRRDLSEACKTVLAFLSLAIKGKVSRELVSFREALEAEKAEQAVAVKQEQQQQEKGAAAAGSGSAGQRSVKAEAGMEQE